MHVNLARSSATTAAVHIHLPTMYHVFASLFVVQCMLGKFVILAHTFCPCIVQYLRASVSSTDLGSLYVLDQTSIHHAIDSVADTEQPEVTAALISSDFRVLHAKVFYNV